MTAHRDIEPGEIGDPTLGAPGEDIPPPDEADDDSIHEPTLVNEDDIGEED